VHSAPEPPSARTTLPIPVGLEALVLKCLEKTPGLRCQSALDFRAALEALAAIAPWSDHDAEAWWKNEGDALVLAVRAETASRIEGVLTVGGA